MIKNPEDLRRCGKSMKQKYNELIELESKAMLQYSQALAIGDKQADRYKQEAELIKEKRLSIIGPGF